MPQSKNRLQKYNKSYIFSTISEFDNLIYKYKQEYFYTISPDIYFTSFWNTYFGI